MKVRAKSGDYDVVIKQRDDGRISVLVTGNGWAVSSSFTDDDACTRFAEAVIAEKKVRGDG